MTPTVAHWHVALAFVLTFFTYIVLKGWHSRRLFYKLRQRGLVSLDPLSLVLEISDT